MQAYYIIWVLIHIGVPAIITIALIYTYRRSKRVFRWLVMVPVLLIGVVVGLGIASHLRYAEYQDRMADAAGHLMQCATLIRDGNAEQAIDPLDGEINWRLRVSIQNRDMKELSDETWAVWQEAKVYYDKYDVTGYSFTNDAAVIRRKLRQVPWSQHEADRRAFEAKYKSGTPQTAPELDIAKWVGPSLSLDDLRDRVVLLDFWGLRCKPCIAALPKVQELHEKFKDDGLTVIAVHGRGGNFEEISKFVEKNNYSFAVAVDAEKTVRGYAVFGIPSYYLIDKKGCLVWGPEHDVPSEEQIEALLKDPERLKPPTL